jgi:subtilisin family serine protease
MGLYIRDIRQGGKGGDLGVFVPVTVIPVDGQSHIYRYANQGHYITVAAPGVSVAAADAGGGIARYSGTSFAAPHIAAWMARCLSKSGSGAGGACSAKMVKSAKDLGAPGRDPVYGYGLIE